MHNVTIELDRESAKVLRNLVWLVDERTLEVHGVLDGINEDLKVTENLDIVLSNIEKQLEKQGIKF